jgi:hypothetical protein
VANTRSSRGDTSVQQAGYRPLPKRTHWTGLIGFAGFMMLMLGFFQAIEGLAAIFNDGFYHVRPNGLVLHVDYTVWGWAHLILGIAIFLAGIGVLSGNLFGRIVGVALAGLSAIVNMLFAEAAPVWAVIIIIVDVFVIYALIVHGREMEA